MSKSPDAFRTISEVADWLGVQAHVLRFWESKFAQVKPVKRAGGRRYYRPVDMQLLGGIKRLLHDDGMTIKGVQKMLREQGVAEIAALSAPLDDTVVDDASDTAPAAAATTSHESVVSETETSAEPDVPIGVTPRFDLGDEDWSTQPPARTPPETSGTDAPTPPSSAIPTETAPRPATVPDTTASDLPEEEEIVYVPGILSKIAQGSTIGDDDLHNVRSLVQDLQRWVQQTQSEAA